MKYIVKGKKLVTVSKLGTIENGAMAIENGKIINISSWQELKEQYTYDFPIFDYSSYVITPSLVDCHTHLLEFAPTSLYPVSPNTHFIAAKAILFKALSSGITALGEQICGHPQCDFSIEEYRNTIKNFPMDISFAATSISIGFENLAHFTSITKSQALNKQDLINPLIIKKLAEKSDYPGENIFINATPANFTEKQVPRAGELIYTKDELEKIAETYHNLGKKIGAHVAGEPGIELALNAGIDVLHHAHGITKKQIEKAANQEVHVVATPMGGTHLLPNFPEEILKLVQHNIPVSISTDAYLPPHPEATWLPFKDHTLKGPDSLMAIARPSMKLLQQNGYEENEILALLTANPASLLGRENHFGKLELGYDANFLVAEGIPGLDITRLESVKKVYFRGKEVINRMYS